SCLTSLSTSASRISSTSSVFCLRTTRTSPSSSVTAGPVIQFRGLYPPASSCTRTEPSALRISSRTASGSTAVRRPVERTSQRATSRRTRAPYWPFRTGSGLASGAEPGQLLAELEDRQLLGEAAVPAFGPRQSRQQRARVARVHDLRRRDRVGAASSDHLASS